MKMKSVMTWMPRPARETSTPILPLLALPLDVEDVAPPYAWRMRETRSQGMKK